MNMRGNQRIAVLCGGLSGERDTSIRSGEAAQEALAARGHHAFTLFVDRDIDMAVRQAHADVAFLAVAGRWGEDGCIQGLLEILGIPYTGSGVLASALAMSKAKTKEILRLHNVPTPPGYRLRADGLEDVVRSHAGFGFPAVVKPSGESSSLGVTVVQDQQELEAAAEEAFRFDDEILVERHVEGREVSVAVLDGRALGGVEIQPRAAFYDFASRRIPGRCDYQAATRLGPDRYRSLLRLAVMAYEALGCDGAATVDLIASERNNEVVLEVDTLPALAPGSILARVAESAGLAFPDLVEEMLQGARLRAHGHRRDRRARQLRFGGPERRVGMLPTEH